MITEIKTSKRIYSLDSLRAIMMLLGLVLHSAVTYGVYENSAWSLKDSITHVSNDYIVNFIHTFRMQIFFLVAGFFGSMLFYERKVFKMIKNRVVRIVFPFILFTVLLWPTVFFSFGYTKLVFEGNVNALETIISFFSNPFVLIPQHTFHLWFLYYLVLITGVSVILALVLQKFPRLTNYISCVFNWIISRPSFRIIVFASISSIFYSVIGSWSVGPSISFFPNFNTFSYYFIFYIVGWILFKSKHLLYTFMKNDWLFTILGVILFSFYFFVTDIAYIFHIIIKSTIVWLFIFGIIGLFMRYANYYSPIMRYISDASYWVYLVHLPLTAIIPALISDLIMPATLKFILVLIITSFLCFLSYHYFVRGTVIGKFLNGRKYSGKITDIKV